MPFSERQRHTVMQWDKKSKDWFWLEYCASPEDLQEELLSSYRMNEAEKITKARRELPRKKLKQLLKVATNYLLYLKYKPYKMECDK